MMLQTQRLKHSFCVLLLFVNFDDIILCTSFTYVHPIFHPLVPESKYQQWCYQNSDKNKALHGLYCKENDHEVSSSSPSSHALHKIKYERISSRTRILDLYVFRGFSISANEYILQQQGQNSEDTKEQHHILSHEDAVLHLTSTFDAEGRDRKLEEYAKNSGRAFDHVVNFVAIVEQDDNVYESSLNSIIDRTNGVIASISAQIKRQSSISDDMLLPHVSLKNLNVHTNFRRQGIASALVQMVKEYTKEANISSIVLEVDPSNYGAIRLYEKEGFEELDDEFGTNGKMFFNL